jgi:hypothetical protein
MTYVYVYTYMCMCDAYIKYVCIHTYIRMGVFVRIHTYGEPSILASVTMDGPARREPSCDDRWPPMGTRSLGPWRAART